jgi:hypothetical protein
MKILFVGNRLEAAFPDCGWIAGYIGMHQRNISLDTGDIEPIFSAAAFGSVFLWAVAQIASISAIHRERHLTMSTF